MMNAVIVEDFLLIAEAWCSLLLKKGFENVKICESAEDLHNYLESCTPNLIFMDINIKGDTDGIALTDAIDTENIPVMFITTHSTKEFVDAAFKSGARAFVTKNSSTGEISKAVDVVMSGGQYICDQLSDQYNIIKF